MTPTKESKFSLSRELHEQSEYKIDQSSLAKAIKLNDDEVLESVIKTLSNKYRDSEIDLMINNLFKD